MKKISLLSFLVVLALLPAVAQQAKDTIELREVVVTGTREATSAHGIPFTVSVITRDQVEQTHSVAVLPSAMREVPGLMLTGRSVMGYGVSTGGTGGISLRGLSGSAGQMLVLVDGHPQYSGIYGHPVADSYRSLTTDRVEVLRGPASVLYGSNAMGGVINIITRNPSRDGVWASAEAAGGSYNTWQTSASLSMRQGRFSATASAQANRTDNHRPHMGFGQTSGYLNLGYDFSSHWNARANFDLTQWEASNPGTTDQPKLDNDQWITRGAASLVLENHYGRTSGALSLYNNFGRHKIDDGYLATGGTPQTDYFRSEDALTGLSWYQTLHPFEGNRITLGFDAYHIYGHAWYIDRLTDAVVTTPRRLKQSANEQNNELAGYVDCQQRLAPQLTLDAGLRYDYHTTAGGEWVPQAGLVWQAFPSAELKATLGKGFRNPNMKEMYMYGTANHDSLRAERLWNYELAWSHRLSSLTYGLNLFYIKGDNLIQTVAGTNINTGSVENSGIELEATWHATDHLRLTTNHSLLQMVHKVVAAPTYKGYLAAHYRCGGFQATLGLQGIAGLYTEVGANEQTANFCLLDASVGYAFNRGLSLWLRGDNLLNQSYEIVKGYPMPRTNFMCGVRWDVNPQ
ncbi:MAG: TonB-dependent receptor [Bacteroidales bacterium]|nr:TonB-dependent receptor [Bacteroidales bacterium]